MEAFVVGAEIENAFSMRVVHSVDQNFVLANEYIDGSNRVAGANNQRLVLQQASGGGGNGMMLAIPKATIKTFFGLHKVETRWSTQAATATADSQTRTMEVEARA
jgi:hypothetical protein